MGATYNQKGIFVTAELQVGIALLVVLHMHCLSVGAGQQAGPHGLESSVGLCEVNASNGDAVSRLHTACQLSPHLQVQAPWGGPLGYLCAQRHLSSSNHGSPQTDKLTMLQTLSSIMSGICRPQPYDLSLRVTSANITTPGDTGM